MCVLRAASEDMDVDAFLATSPLAPTRVHHKGQPYLALTRPDGRRNETSGFNVSVSEREWDDLGGQIEDARAFLSQHEAELRRLTSFPGVDRVSLDFPVYLRIGTNDVAVQSDRLPADLLLAAGGLGIDIELTIYPLPGKNG